MDYSWSRLTHTVGVPCSAVTEVTAMTSLSNLPLSYWKACHEEQPLLLPTTLPPILVMDNRDVILSYSGFLSPQMG